MSRDLSKGEKKLEDRGKARARCANGCQTDKSKPSVSGKKLPAAAPCPTTGPFYPWEWEELEKPILNPMQRIEFARPSGLALLTGLPLPLALLFLPSKIMCAHTYLCKHTHDTSAPLKKKKATLGEGQAQFTGMCKSSKSLLRDGFYGFSKFLFPLLKKKVCDSFLFFIFFLLL